MVWRYHRVGGHMEGEVNMKLAKVKNNEGRVDVMEVTNRYGNKEYIVDVSIKGRGFETYTYKTIESAMRKYKKATKEMNEMYLVKCN